MTDLVRASLPDDFADHLKRRRAFRTESGVVTAVLRGGAVRIEPGEYTIHLTEFEGALAAMRRGQYRIAPVGKTPVIAAILTSFFPDLAAAQRARATTLTQERARVLAAARAAVDEQRRAAGALAGAWGLKSSH